MATPVTAFEHIRANNVKTFLLLLLFPCSLAALFYVVCLFVFGGLDDETLTLVNQTVLNGLPWIFGIGFFWILISIFQGDKMVLGFADAQPLSPKGRENKEIYKLVENTAIMAGLPMPKVYVIDDDSLNAFATGYSPKSASIALTRGIIHKLKPAELQGVIAHELAHIGNRDIRLDMIIVAGLGIFALLAENLRFSLPRTASRRDNDFNDFSLFFGTAYSIGGVSNAGICGRCNGGAYHASSRSAGRCADENIRRSAGGSA